MAAVSRLDFPSKKMLIKDLRQANNITPAEGLICKLWEINTAYNSITFSIVWIQGRVKNVGSGEFFLEDMTGTAYIISNNVPAACPKPATGQYMMVIGQLDAAGNQPVIRASKLQDLSNDAALQALWPFEIQDVRNHCRT